MKLILTTIALFAFFDVDTSGAFGSPKCGQVLLNKGISNWKKEETLEGQWSWHAAIYQKWNSEEDPKYKCGGTLLSTRHVITAGHCVSKKLYGFIDKDTLTVYLGKYNINDSGDKVQVSAVKGIQLHPYFNMDTFDRDLAILELEDPVIFSDWVQPACLWSESDIDLKNIVGLTGSVASWSFDGTRMVNEEQALLKMPVVSQLTCIRSLPEFYGRFTSDSTYCAKPRDTWCGVGGDGMVFEIDGSWYLRGVCSLAVKDEEFACDTQYYVIFADIAQSLPWIRENILN